MKVQSRMCVTCIYRPDSPLDLKALEKQIADPYMEGFFETFRACHHATNDICCRGFWNKHKNDFQLGQISQRLNMVEFVKVDKLGGKK